jgi:hypothetical protein
LEAGQYRLIAEQEVVEFKAAGTGAFSTGITFSVDAPRFALSPPDIYSVYPPKGQTGAFGGSLPHVVLSRRTLPWERKLVPGSRPPDDRSADDVSPWLALLMFAAADFPGGDFPEVKTRKVKDLINPGAGIAGPDLGKAGLAPHEHEDDLCTTVDLPVAVFAAIAPRPDELPLLAHVREINTDAKETASYLGEGWYSIVVGNRVPRLGPVDVENRACLVSLEGLADCLPGGKRAGHNAVRLAVLSSWSFFARPGDPFKGAVAGMTTGLLALERVDGTGEDVKRVNDALDAGYVPLNHATRLGERTVSWYRGPLTPVRLETRQIYAFRAAADAVVRYDANQGMFDISYAAAFQLGRLLALQSRQFAQSVTAFRKFVRDRVNDVLEKEKVRYTFGNASGKDVAECMRVFLGTDVKGKAGEAQAGEAQAERPDSWAAWTPKIAETEEVRPGELRLNYDFDLTIPEPVGRWLARLVLLYRVPFVYLVPDQRMLKPNSIRFFHLDPNWIKCLLEGACSISRSSPRDELTEEMLRSAFLKLALEQSVDVRGSKGGTETRKVPKWPLSGFIMRSPVVEGWQGLEMHAFEKNGAALDPLRIDRLSPQIILCLFNGELSSVTVSQPAEGIHFGFNTDLKGALWKEKLRTTLDNGAGEQVKNKETKVPALMRNGSDTVLDVTGLAAKMKEKLEAASARDRSKDFTSADFALQMMSSAGRLTISAEERR